MAAQSHRSIPALSSVGIDIGKDVFHLIGFDSNGEIVLRRRVKRLALVPILEKLLASCGHRDAFGWKAPSASNAEKSTLG